jgi:hypothetical protein
LATEEGETPHSENKFTMKSGLKTGTLFLFKRVGTNDLPEGRILMMIMTLDIEISLVLMNTVVYYNNNNLNIINIP